MQCAVSGTASWQKRVSPSEAYAQPVFRPSDQVVARVRQVVEEAAAAPIEAGRAEVAVRRLVDVHGETSYDCPVVVLTPVDPDAAGVVVEVQDDELWWVHANDGPGTELYNGMNEDRDAILGSLVRAVVAGRYRHGPCTEVVRRLFRSPTHTRAWSETFETENGPITSRHFGRDAPSREYRFGPY